MARLPRFVIPGQPQHIIQRGNNRQAIFAEETDFRFFQGVLVAAAAENQLSIHAYVWMTNHIHLLATPETAYSISKVFQSAGRRYVGYFNGKYGRSGTLWEGRYRATVVDTEHYLLAVMRYIELNPVRAGMVSAPGDYPWSSYRYHARGESGLNADWLMPHREYLRLGPGPLERQAAYRAVCQEVIPDEDLAEIRACSHKGWALGSERFKGEIEKRGQRRAVSKGVGRPRTRKILSQQIVEAPK